MLSELGGVAIGEKIGVDLLEFLHIKRSTGAVLQESLKKRRQDM